MQQEHNELEPHLGYRVLTSLLLLDLLLEWLYPWLHAGEWGTLLHPHYLLWMTVIMLAVGIMRPRIYWFMSVGLAVLLVCMYMLFSAEGQHIGQWLIKVIPSLSNNASDMLKYGIWYMSDEFRTMLLFIGWLLLAPALQSVIWHYHFSLALGAGTIAYLITIHTVLGIDIWLGLLRVIGAGLLLIALTAGQKLEPYMLIRSRRGNRYGWISVMLLTAIIVSVSFLVSDQKVKRSEPVAWAEIFSNSVAEELAAWSQQSSGVPLKNVTSGNYRKQSEAIAGYDLDDRQLGAKLRTSDGEVVFYGWSPQESYWRGEAKSTYTGKGWSNEDGALTLHKTADDVEAASAELGGRAKGERIQQTVTYTEPVKGMPLLQGGIKGILTELEASDPERKLSNYIVEPATGVLYPPTTDAAIKSYTLITELPITDPALLNEPEDPNELLAQRAWEVDMLREYLQLPDSLPERVVALAAEVAGGGLTSRYDQVKAIEQYLQESYSYSLNSKLPSENEDFVDHFLFEQKRGYCVHFASAMVVMLRSQDIPARWVKGYQSGEAVDQRLSEAGMLEMLYKVSERDAHAWVEVYFPEVGWVPFDPTPSDESRNEQAASVWLNQLDGLKDAMLTKLKAWSSLLSLTQWQWLPAANAGLLTGWISLLLSWPSIKRRYYLRSYSKAYRQLEQDRKVLEGNGQLNTQAGIYERSRLKSQEAGYDKGQTEAQTVGLGEANAQADDGADQHASYSNERARLPARSKKQLACYRQAQTRGSKLQRQLRHSLEWLVDDVFCRLEKKSGIHTNGHAWLTWRQRAEAHLQSGKTSIRCQQQLNGLLTAIEQLRYSNRQDHLTPHELQLCLLAIRKGTGHKPKRNIVQSSGLSMDDGLHQHEKRL